MQFTNVCCFFFLALRLRMFVRTSETIKKIWRREEVGETQQETIESDENAHIKSIVAPSECFIVTNYKCVVVVFVHLKRIWYEYCWILHNSIVQLSIKWKKKNQKHQQKLIESLRPKSWMKIVFFFKWLKFSIER